MSRRRPSSISIRCTVGGRTRKSAWRSANLGVGTSTVFRTKRRFVEEGLEAALGEEPRPGAERKLDATAEALRIATARSAPPGGRARWTLELLVGDMVKLTSHRSLSPETVRRRLAENELKPWLEKMWCIPKADAEFDARREDVLEPSAEAPDGQRPVVCFDEKPRQRIGLRGSGAHRASGRRGTTAHVPT